MIQVPQTMAIAMQFVSCPYPLGFSNSQRRFVFALVGTVGVANAGGGSERRNARRLESAILAEVSILRTTLVKRMLAFVRAIGVADAGDGRERRDT